MDEKVMTRPQNRVFDDESGMKMSFKVHEPPSEAGCQDGLWVKQRVGPAAGCT